MDRYLYLFAVIRLAGCAGSSDQLTANLPAQRRRGRTHEFLKACGQ